MAAPPAGDKGCSTSSTTAPSASPSRDPKQHHRSIGCPASSIDRPICFTLSGPKAASPTSQLHCQQHHRSISCTASSITDQPAALPAASSINRLHCQQHQTNTSMGKLSKLEMRVDPTGYHRTSYPATLVLLEEAGVWINCKNRALRWLEDDRLIDCKRDINIPVRGLSPEMNLTGKQRATEHLVYKENLRKMRDQLSTPKPSSRPHRRNRRNSTMSRDTLINAGLDINVISPAAFMLHARQKEVVIGHRSVYEVEKLIQDRQEETNQLDPEEELRQLIQQKAPGTVDSDKLPPHREGVDHDIQLTAREHTVKQPAVQHVAGATQASQDLP
ncbi:uncharacterized protein BDR25DRAFT_396934 [Lindgomyces ingoldianus]|uniref:Uncharacterized protein n=1 Tax=Lindgomyces ingoldianus TaxID=673940 RepID=A0ACB6QAE7_9PLEO|nr:uncharacterized protein BDR25DRAFT_396934 [Lindgomyces ingoldianus]KAF2463933.1 hypothetical protein BDR25DRAFT_396934 [Lindgomyces ingoldianus]